jgi:hypothetical protein
MRKPWITRRLLLWLATLCLGPGAANAQRLPVTDAVASPVADSVAIPARPSRAAQYLGALAGSAGGLLLVATSDSEVGGHTALALWLSSSSLSSLGAWVLSPAGARPEPVELMVGATVGAGLGMLAGYVAFAGTGVLEGDSGWAPVVLSYTLTQALFTVLIGGD